MSKERKEEYDVIPLNAAGWRDQKLIAAELRRLREASGMTQEALAEKLGEPYTEELIARYEDGSAEIMETWTVFAIVEALGATPMDIAPKSLMARQCLESGYGDLNEESRNTLDVVVGKFLVTLNFPVKKSRSFGHRKGTLKKSKKALDRSFFVCYHLCKGGGGARFALRRKEV